MGNCSTTTLSVTSVTQVHSSAAPHRATSGARNARQLRPPSVTRATNALAAPGECPGAASTSSVPGTGIPVADVPVADVPVADVPVADVPVADVPVADVPVADLPGLGVQAHAAPGVAAPALDIPARSLGHQAGPWRP